MKNIRIILLTASVLFLTGCAAETKHSSSKNEAISVNEQAAESLEYEEISPIIEADDAKIGYLGPEGTYTQEACGVFFDGKGSYTPYETVTEAVDALINGESTFAVIPQENTIGGAVTDYVDILISQEGVSVIGEVELPIDQNLLVLPGTEGTQIKTIYSHKQGIAQGKEWIDANLPDAEVIEVSSTAEGAKKVSEGGDKSCAAIASAASADVYGLDIFAAAIQNNKSNKTRFYVLSTGQPPTAKAERTAFIAKGDAQELPKLMSRLEELSIKLEAIHDRPRKTELGEYSYVIECKDMPYSKYTELCKDTAFDMRFLGCFDVK